MTIEINTNSLFYSCIFFIFILFLNSQTVYSQDDPYDIEKFQFINYNKNKIEIFDTIAYQQLFDKFTNVGLKGEGKVRIVHIGDSHLQADFLSGYFRRRLQTFFLGAIGGRGFVFPYKVAKTNNPLDYRVSSNGKWESCKNIDSNNNCLLGLSGISVSTNDTASYIKMKLNDPKLPGYDFDKLMVFHEFSSKSYQPIIKHCQVKKTTPYPDKGYTLFEFNKNLTSTTLGFHKSDSNQNEFKLFGFNFESNDSGIIYHTVGVNGAMYSSFLKCQLFGTHLQALEPDWVIISLGTNDCYTDNFNASKFKQNVDSLLTIVSKTAPHAAVLITTPGDHRIKRQELNVNSAKASEILTQLAKQHKLSYWNLNAIMGGEGSIDIWRYLELAHTDYLHFTQKGYEYQSKLLFNAFLKAYDNYFAQQILFRK